MPLIADDTSPEHWLLCRVGRRQCALPLASVVEIMRPLPIEPLAASQPFVLGLSLIRGSPVPVVDAGSLFGDPGGRAGRLVTIRVGERRAALAVDSVAGLRAIGAGAGAELPPLLSEAAGEVVAAIGTLDAELLLFLRAARLAPETVGEASGAAGPTS